MASVLDGNQRSVWEAKTRIDIAVQVYPLALSPRLLKADINKALMEAHSK